MFSLTQCSLNGTTCKNRKKFVITMLFPDVLQILLHFVAE